MTKHQLNILIFSGVLYSSYVLFGFGQKFNLVLLLSTLLFIGIVCLGVFKIQFNYFLYSLNKTKSDYCLITFDDGPSEAYTPLILEILKKHQIAALFFVIGSKAEQNTPVMNEIIKAGHLIGNHSFSHSSWFAFKSLREVNLELNKTETAINPNSNLLFRPPVGITNPIISRAIKRQKFKSIGWSLRSLDTVFKNRNHILNRLLKKIKNGDIILFHDNLKITTELLEEFIIESKKLGIKFASHSDLKHIIHE